VPTEASGWRSTVRRSMARLVTQPGQKTSSHGVPATSAALIVGDHSMSRPVASRRFQRFNDELGLKARGLVRLQLGGAGLDVEPSCPDAHGGSIGRPVSKSIRVTPSGGRLDLAPQAALSLTSSLHGPYDCAAGEGE
jgi:hypothetical protein